MLSSVFAWTPQRLQAQWASEPESTPVLLATGGMYETLGLRPAAGRLLTPSDSGRSAADAQPVAVLSYPAWQRRFGGDPSAIGQTVRIEGMPFTIVGVTPPGFFGVAVGVPVDVTIPLTILPRLRADEREALTSVGNSWLNIMGRLRPGTSVAAADAEFQTLWPQILSATADGVSPGFRQRYLTFTSGLDSAASGYSPVRRQFRDALWLLFGLVCLLLVAACATVANLLLAASAGRRHELALRVALGAARRRIAQQLFVEGLMLAAGGAALGLLFSAWAGDLLIGLISTSYDTVAVSVAPDWRVFTFIALTVGLATTVFTMAPIASAARIEAARMHEAGPTADRKPLSRAIGARPRCGAGRHLADAPRRLCALRAKSVATPGNRHRLRPRESVGSWPRRDVAGERIATACPRSERSDRLDGPTTASCCGAFARRQGCSPPACPSRRRSATNKDRGGPRLQPMAGPGTSIPPTVPTSTPSRPNTFLRLV